MKKILMGFMLGVFLTVGLYFFKGRNTLLHFNTGFLLDQDALYMEDGSIIYGRVLQEDGEGYETYRVGAINEDSGEITIFATEYDPTKFSETDSSTALGQSRTSIAGPQIVPGVNNGSIVLEVNQ